MSTHEPKKVSTRGSGAKKTGQRHQNTLAWHPNKNSKIDKKIKALPVYGLCKRCTDVILWRKKFRKYKPLTAPRKCTNCEQKAVKEAYHVFCNACATHKKVCAKCLESKDILTIASEIKTEQNLNKERTEEERLMSLMTERARRTYLRKLEKGDDVSEIVKKAETKAKDDDDDFDDFDDDEEEDGVEEEEESDDEEEEEVEEEIVKATTQKLRVKA